MRQRDEENFMFGAERVRGEVQNNYTNLVKS